LGEALIVGGIDDGVPALGQGDAAEGVAVTESAIDQRQRDADAGEPERDGYGYGNGRNLYEDKSTCKAQKCGGAGGVILDFCCLILACFRTVHLGGPIAVALYYWGDVARLIRKKRNSNGRLNL
jgi:hypothetical protein